MNVKLKFILLFLATFMFYSEFLQISPNLCFKLYKVIWLKLVDIKNSVLNRQFDQKSTLTYRIISEIEQKNNSFKHNWI